MEGYQVWRIGGGRNPLLCRQGQIYERKEAALRMAAEIQACWPNFVYIVEPVGEFKNWALYTILAA